MSVPLNKFADFLFPLNLIGGLYSIKISWAKI